MFYPEELVEEIRGKNDIIDVISSHVKLQKKGSSYFGLCPFHNEKSPSFSVSPEKQMYYCFGCGAGGNVFTFVMEYENYTFPETLKYLAERVGISLPEEEYSEEVKKQADLKATILELNKQAANYFYYQLHGENGKQAYHYLQERAVSNEIQKKFGLGYATKYGNDLYQYLKSKGYQDAQLKDSGLFTFDEARGVHDKFWNRVIFPILDVNNRVIGFGGRVMGEGMPKYLNSPETRVFDKSRNLYGLNFARIARKSYMLLCEGYMDVISLHQAGFANAVASLGTAFTEGHASLLKRYTKEVILTYDSDEAGVKAALRAIPILKDAGISVKILSMQPYKDPDEFIKNLGAEEYEKRISEAENSFLFQIEVLERSYDMKDPEAKTKFFQAVALRLLEFREEIERNNYIQAIAEKYQMGYENMRHLVNQTGIRYGDVQAKQKPKQPIQKKQEKDAGRKKAQKLLLTWLIEEKGLYSKIKAYISPGDFTEERYQTVAKLLFCQLEMGQVNPARIISHFINEDEQHLAAELFNTQLKELETKSEKEKAIHDIICQVLGNSVEYATKTLDATDIQGLQKILEKKRTLEEIKKLHISLD